MPIHQPEWNRIVVQFGSGDVGVSLGHNKGMEDRPFVVLHSVEPRAIGEDCPEFYGKPISYSVGLTFEKPESIDVLVEALLELKKIKFKEVGTEPVEPPSEGGTL